MIERRPLESNAVVGESLQELDDVGSILRAEANVADARAEVAARGHISVAPIELHDLFERCGATSVEVRTSQLHVTEARRLERTTCTACRRSREQRRTERVESGGAGIVVATIYPMPASVPEARIESAAAALESVFAETGSTPLGPPTRSRRRATC